MFELVCDVCGDTIGGISKDPKDMQIFCSEHTPAEIEDSEEEDDSEEEETTEV